MKRKIEMIYYSDRYVDDMEDILREACYTRDSINILGVDFIVTSIKTGIEDNGILSYQCILMETNA